MNQLVKPHLVELSCLLILAAGAILMGGCRDSKPDVSQQLSDTIRLDNGIQFLHEDQVPQEEVVTPTAEPPRTYLEDARQHMEKNEWDEAIRIYTMALQHVWPESSSEEQARQYQAEAFLARGKAFLAKSFPRIALKDFSDAVQLGDVDIKSRAYVQRARAHGELNRWAPAVADCTQAIRLSPGNGEAFLVQGQALAELGQITEAGNALQEAERLGIRTAWKVPVASTTASVLDRARAALESDNPIVAREILQTAVLEGRDSWETNGLLALTYFQLYDFQAAITASTRAMSVNPEYADAYRIRGLSWYQRDNFDRAIADLQTAISLDGSLAEQLAPYVVEARRRGGVDPGLRVQVVSRIKQQVAADSRRDLSVGEAERWLLQLMEMPRSTQQVDHFKSILQEKPAEQFSSLNWLTDFLMLDRQVPAVRVLTTWLEREEPPVSDVEQQLRDALANRSAAASQGVNLFPDFAAYAIEYRFYRLLQECIDLGICRLTIDHIHQAVEIDDPTSLQLILPHAILVDREVTGVLRHCVENNKRAQARLIVNQHPGNLNWQIIEFLDMTGESANLQRMIDMTRFVDLVGEQGMGTH